MFLNKKTIHRPGSRKIVASSFEDKMQTRKMVPVGQVASFLRRQQQQQPGAEQDWVTIGVLTGKSAPKTSSSGRNFSRWTITDLGNGSVCLFLFGEVFKEHWTELEGRIIALLNPRAMEDRGGSADAAGSSAPKDPALTLDRPSQLLVLGTSLDYGTCKAIRKDGAPCSMVVNTRKGEYCTHHVAAAYKKAHSKRTDINSKYPCCKKIEKKRKEEEEEEE